MFPRSSELNVTQQDCSNQLPEQDNHFPHSNHYRSITTLKRCISFLSSHIILLAFIEIKSINLCYAIANKPCSPQPKLTGMQFCVCVCERERERETERQRQRHREKDREGKGGRGEGRRRERREGKRQPSVRFHICPY